MSKSVLHHALKFPVDHQPPASHGFGKPARSPRGHNGEIAAAASSAHTIRNMVQHVWTEMARETTVFSSQGGAHAESSIGPQQGAGDGDLTISQN